jgi:multimeric flavodoxin WrbA
MKVVGILGTRSPEGQTARAAGALLDALARKGVKVERMFLPAMKIERCRQCDEKGWGLCRSEGRCVIEDDFASLVAEIRSADAAVFATPVYFGDLSESLRAFLDRLRRITRHATGKAGIEGKAALGVCVAGGGGGGAPSCAVSLEKVLSQATMDPIDVVAVRRQNLEMKLGVLRQTGEWLAERLANPVAE